MKIRDTILNSIHPVITQSKHVSINHRNLALFARSLVNIPLPSWDNSLQFLGNEEETIQYYFFVDSINFCFWSLTGKEKWSYKKANTWLTGYYAFAYAIKEAVEKDKLFLKAEFLANIDFNDFSLIFTGKNELLLLPERHTIIQNNFAILSNRFSGKARNLIQQAHRDVNELTTTLLECFPSFRDEAIYKGKKVYLLKRAQILVSDISHALGNKGCGFFYNLEDLTIFADYKLPQLLESQRVLEYTPTLKEKIKNEELLPKGSEEEIEIRANTIFACEQIKDILTKRGRKLTSSELDWILWVIAKKTTFKLPHHKTLTSYY